MRVLSANDCVRAESVGSLRIGDTTVPRSGYGTMRLPGANKLVAEAFYPYPEDLLIATKVGARRNADRGFVTDGAPEAIRRACQHDAAVLRVDVPAAALELSADQIDRLNAMADQ